MKIVKNISEITQIVSDLQKNKKQINLIPTMGNIHAGHLSLLTEAKKFDGINIVSIFVWIGLIQSIIGSILGLIFALIVLKFRNEILFFLSYNLNVNLLPAELYQLSRLPSQTLFYDVVIVIGMVVIFCVIAVMIPAIKAAQLQPIKALNFE